MNFYYIKLALLNVSGLKSLIDYAHEHTFFSQNGKEIKTDASPPKAKETEFATAYNGDEDCRFIEHLD